MPITELKDDRITHYCAACEATRELAIDKLTAGIEREGYIDPSIIAVPACISCGAREFLIRSPGGKDSAQIALGSYAHLHRLLVDSLHERLAKTGRSIDGATRRELRSPQPADEELRRWFPEGPKLSPLPDVEGSDDSRSGNDH